MVVDFNPVALQIGPLAIHWYALAYLAGFLAGWRLILWIAEKKSLPLTRQQIDDFLNWAIVGVLLGGRLGYVLFYNPSYYLQHPLESLYLWQGGMSFHGGLLGIVAAVLVFARKRRINPLVLGDVVALVGPIGLFLGRIANFVNGELYGRPTDVSWGMVFPRASDLASRHPSQLYEAGLEGIVLFVLLLFLAVRTQAFRRAGCLSGVFLIGYSLFRFMVEFFREPDPQLGFLITSQIFGGTTMGQLLCIPMFLLGILVLTHSLRRAQ